MGRPPPPPGCTAMGTRHAAVYHRHVASAGGTWFAHWEAVADRCIQGAGCAPVDDGQHVWRPGVCLHRSGTLVCDAMLCLRVAAVMCNRFAAVAHLDDDIGCLQRPADAEGDVDHQHLHISSRKLSGSTPTLGWHSATASTARCAAAPITTATLLC
jgi:hypothetical protein